MLSFPLPQPCSVTLSLPSGEHWTLYHVLLDWIKQETTAEDPASIESLLVEVFQTFEILDAGETSFTTAQLETIQAVVAEYHHSASSPS